MPHLVMYERVVCILLKEGSACRLSAHKHFLDSLAAFHPWMSPLLASPSRRWAASTAHCEPTDHDPGSCSGLIAWI